MRRPILLLSLAAFMAGATWRVLDTLLPVVAEDFNVSTEEAAQAITAFALAYGGCQLIYGWLGRQFGLYRIITIACGLAAMGAAATAFASDLPSLIMARFWTGMLVAAIIPLSMAFIGENVDYQFRQPVIARFIMGSTLGGIAGQAAAGLFAQWLDWRDLFWLMAFGFAAVSLCLIFEQRSPRVPPHKPPERPVSPVLAYSKVLAQPWARIVLITVGLEGVIMGLFPYLSSHLAQNIGLQPSHIGLIMGSLSIGGIGYALMVSKLHRHLGELGLVLYGGLLLAAGHLALIVLSQALAFAIFAVIIGLGYTMLHNTLQTNATQMASFDRSAAISLFAFSLFMGHALGVTLGGLALPKTGYPALFATAALGSLLLALTFRWFLQRKPAGFVA